MAESIFKFIIDNLYKISTLLTLLILLIYIKVNKRKKRKNQIDIFNTLNSNLRSLMKQTEEQAGDGSVSFNVSKFNFFEHFAFFANRDYLTENMIQQFAGIIPRECKRVSNNPALIGDLMVSGMDWSELRKFYMRRFKIKYARHLPLVLRLSDVGEDGIRRSVISR
jgi:hypothetical protein